MKTIVQKHWMMKILLMNLFLTENSINLTFDLTNIKIKENFFSAMKNLLIFQPIDNEFLFSLGPYKWKLQPDKVYSIQSVMLEFTIISLKTYRWILSSFITPKTCPCDCYHFEYLDIIFIFIVIFRFRPMHPSPFFKGFMWNS